MARRWVVRDSDNVIVEFTEWAGRQAPTGHTIYDDPTGDGDWVVGGTYDGTDYADPTGRRTTAQRGRNRRLSILYEAYQSYHGTTRKQGWVSLRDGTTANQGIRATDRWVYHQIAIGDRIARREWLASATPEFRAAAIEHIANWVGNLGYTWYSAVTGTAGRATIASWAGTSTGVIAGSSLYTDILEHTGANIGTPRTPATEFNLITPALTIATNFDPEFPTLRSS